jgi:hypothetical protein
MMTAADRDDVLARASRALCDAQDAALDGVPSGADDPGDPTWTRVVGDVRRARRRRRWMSAAVLHLGVWLAATGVWAAVTGRLTAIVDVPASLLRPRHAPTAAPAKSHARRGQTPAPALPAAEVDEPPITTGAPAAGPATDPPPMPAAVPAPIRARSPRAVVSAQTRVAPPPIAHAPTVPPAVPASSPRAPIEPLPFSQASGGATPPAAADPLYREAHVLHFVRRDFATALAAWDRYLAAGPGALSVEARYNRAIALAHLGRDTEAAAALRPFADGEHGGYRQKEARALIARLAKRDPR